MFWFYKWQAMLGPFLLILQIALIIHVVKTGRPWWWIWVLLALPGIGAVVYLVVEVLPDLRQTGRGDAVISFKPRAWMIRDLRNELVESDTVDRRLDLAQELFLAGKPQEAYDVSAEALQGVFCNDAHLLVQVARYSVELGRAKEALTHLGNIKSGLDKKLEREIMLLRGRAFLLLGHNQEAVDLLTPITGSYIGEEPRYYLGVALDALGQNAEARAYWSDIKFKFRRANALWRRSEKRWYKLACEKLKSS